MSKFTARQNSFFNASNGAGSIVTIREEYDSQVTLDASEKQVLHLKIPQRLIPRGPVTNLPTGSKFRFYNLNLSSPVDLNLNLPKRIGNETRLYLSDSADFKPDPGDYWFIFLHAQTKELIIGSLDEVAWVASGGAVNGSPIPRVLKPAVPIDDEEDHLYQADVYNTSPAASTSITYKKENRSKTTAIKAIKAASYRCEIDSTHRTFNTSGGTPYIEAHHIVPISQQSILGVNLDVPANIVALCPNCHRAVHYSEKSERIKHLENLFLARLTRLKTAKIDLSLFELAQMYNCN
jgi:5-methylcytosine-specific restriction enzyme A